MKYKSLTAGKLANRRATKAAGRAYWFEPGAMRFFNTRIHGALIGGRYFVTSERMDERFPWKYTVRMFDERGFVEDVGEFQQYSTKDSAVSFARKLTKMEKDVPDNPVKGGFSKEIIAKNIKLLVREGREQKQAVAIAYASARASWRRRNTRGAFPRHLRGKRC